MKEIEAIVSGKVQGVNFRNFVKSKADNLWLYGKTENLPDFKVLVVAQGPEERLKRLIELLWKGPFGSRVSNVEVSWKSPTEKYKAFTINYE